MAKFQTKNTLYKSKLVLRSQLYFMLSKEFMRYLINYQPDGSEMKEKSHVKEIEFKDNNSGILAKVYLTLHK